MKNPEFLDTNTVLSLHAMALHRFGGAEGVRDLGSIESALGSAQNAFYYGSGDLYDIAAAYAFHISQAQAFLDGNKRAAVITALSFLEITGATSTPTDHDIYDAMIAIAERRIDKVQLAEVFRRAAV